MDERLATERVREGVAKLREQNPSWWRWRDQAKIAKRRRPDLNVLSAYFAPFGPCGVCIERFLQNSFVFHGARTLFAKPPAFFQKHFDREDFYVVADSDSSALFIDSADVCCPVYILYLDPSGVGLPLQVSADLGGVLLFFSLVREEYDRLGHDAFYELFHDESGKVVDQYRRDFFPKAADVLGTRELAEAAIGAILLEEVEGWIKYYDE